MSGAEAGPALERAVALLRKLAAEPPAKLALPPGTFVFAPGVGEFLAGWTALNSVMPFLAEKGLALRLEPLPFESFSPREQRLRGSAASTAQAIEASHKLRDLEARFPGVFFHAGLGLRLFSPWTTLQDVQYNLALARVTGYPVDGALLTSAIRLEEHPDLKLAAQRAGLLRAGRRGSSDGPAPFRLLHPRVEALRRALALVAGAGDRAAGASGRDARLAAAFVRRTPARLRGLLGLAQTLVEAARTMPGRAGTAGLLSAAGALMARRSWKKRLGQVILPWWLDEPAGEGLVGGGPPAGPGGGPPAGPEPEDRGSEPPPKAGPAGPPRPTTPIGMLVAGRLGLLRAALSRLGEIPSLGLAGWELRSFGENDGDGHYGVSCVLGRDDATLCFKLVPSDDKEAPSLCRSGRIACFRAGSGAIGSDESSRLLGICGLADRCLGGPGREAA